MQCIAPVSIENPLRTPTKPDRFMHVPCGACPTCLKKRSSMWVFRLKEEKKVSSSAYFLTLTYDEENVPKTPCGKNTLNYRDHQLFMKKLRKREKGSKIKYYAVGEYGDQTERPHYHSIIYNVKDPFNITGSWDKGHLRIDECNIKTIAYVAKYVNKQIKFTDREDPRQREKALISKGLGLNYLTENTKAYLKQQLNPYLTLAGGEKIALPRYYKNKTFTEEEKQIINSKSKKHIEETVNFDSFHQELEWKKDQYRKRDKYARQKRTYHG